MRIVVISATEGEVLPLRQAIASGRHSFTSHVELNFFVTGVGILASTFSLTRLLVSERPDFVLQLGIAGAFDDAMPPGKVVAVGSECLGDAGVQENGVFKDLFDLKLQADVAPFSDHKLTNPWLPYHNFLNLDIVSSITVNEITTRQDRIELLRAKYNAQLESMEGAPLHYAALQTNTPFIQLRAVSNIVGDRDKSKWNFKDSFANLASAGTAYLDALYQNMVLKNIEV